MNKMIIIGNLTRDPEMRTTPSGHTVCDFTVAVNGRRSSGGDQTVQYFRITAWRQLGESCAKYLSKGRKAFVSGPLTARTYTANDGSTRMSLEITAEDVEFLPSRSDADAEAPMEQTSSDPSGFTAVETDELPF